MRRVERARNWGLWLTAAACAAGLLGAMPVREAAAQEASTAQADELAAETAYLRAYFTEKETKDLAAADAAYTAILGMRGVPRDLAVRVRLGRVRCLHGLRRGDEARTALAAATSAAKDGAAITATTRDALEAATALLNAKAVDDDAGTLEERIIGALRSGDIKTTVLPFGDRALSHLRSILLTSDDVTLSSRAASAITTMDTDASRKHVKALMGQYDSLRFPREFAVAVARSMPFDMVAELAAPLPVETRRAMWTAALGVFRPFTDAEARRVLADRDARPAMSSLTQMSTPALARYLTRALLDDDPAFARSAEDGVRQRRAWSTEVLDAWLSPPLEVFDSPTARAALLEGVWSATEWTKARPSPEFLDAITRLPEGAILFLRNYADDSDAGRRPGMRLAIRNTVTHGAADVSMALVRARGFGRLMENAGLTEPEELRWLIANWRSQLPLEQVVVNCPSLASPSPGQVAALLEPSNPPAVLTGFLATWATDAFIRSDAAKASFGRFAALLRHEVPAVRAAAADALFQFAKWGRLPDDIDVATILGTEMNAQVRAAILAAVPKSRAADLIAALRDDKETLGPVLRALGSNTSQEIDRRLREILSATSDPSVAATAASALVRRTPGADDTTIAAVIADPGRSAALRSEVALACIATLASSDTVRAEGFIEAIFARTPVPVPLGQGNAVPAAVSRLSAVTRRRIALAALASTADGDRRYGADLARELRDPAAWDRLVVLAEDPEPTVRDAARKALDAIADEEEAVRRYRRVAATKKTRDGIPALLASASVDDRLAGIAAVVAIEDDSQTAELVRLATKDAEEPVRQAARRALETLGDRRVMAREAAGRQEQPTKPAPEETPK